MPATDVIFNIGMAGAAAATADVSGLINKFKSLKTAVYEAVSASEDYYDVVNRTSMDMGLFNQETKGLIDTMTSFKQANALAAAGVKVTAQEFSILGKGAIEVGKALGVGGTETFERLTAAIIRGSERALIPFGIQLDETENKAKAQAEAVQKLTEKFTNMSVEAETMRDKVYAFNNTVGTLRDQLTAPAFVNFIGWIGGVDNGFNELSGALNAFSNDLTAGGQGFASWATSAEGALNIVSGVWAEIRGNTEDATAAADEYYRKLQQGREKEKARRAKIESDREAAEMAMGYAQQGEDSEELERQIAQDEIDREFGMGAYARKGGGGGKRKQSDFQSFVASTKKGASLSGGGFGGLGADDISNALDFDAIDRATAEARSQQNQLQLDLDAQAREERLTAYEDENQRILDMEAQKFANMSEMQKAQYDREKQWDEMRKMDQVNTYASGVATLGSFLGQAASMQDKNSRKGFENSKRLQLAQAAMTLPQATLNAWNSGMQFGPASVVMAPLLVASTLALGIAQIAMISRMKYGGGSAGSSTAGASVSMPSGGLNNYGAGSSSGGGSTIVNNVILDGTMIHSSMIRANDGASQRGDRSFSTAA